MKNRPITKAEMEAFKEDKNVSKLSTGIYPNRRMRRFNFQSSNNPLKRNNRKVTEGRKEKYNFIQSIIEHVKNVYKGAK
jgi:hypothetical protein